MDRLDRIEKILEEGGLRHREAMADVDSRLQYMAARQQYHDEAFERFDVHMRRIEAAIAIDAENIRALARIAEAHQRRLDDIQGESRA